jgi:hypothetical protein
MKQQRLPSHLLRRVLCGRVSRLAIICATLFSATSCKKAPAPAVSQNASSGSLAQLSDSTNAPAAALPIAGSKNISIDGGTDSFAHVTYVPAVKTFDLSEIQSSLQGISSDGHGFVFKNASANIRALKAGDILASPLSKITANNILTSNADVFVQFLATEGVTHAANASPMPCSKQEIKFDAQGCLGAQLFGLTGGAQNTTTLFTKTMTRWDPASDFCKKV